MDHKQALLDIINEKSVIRKQVTLASGKTSNYYVDCRLTSLSGKGAWLSAKLMFPHLKDTQLVGGMTLGADPFLGAILYEAQEQGKTDLDAFIVRKETKSHGMQNSIEGHIFEGARVCLIEDVVTSGGSVLKAFDAVEAAGCKVEKVICLLDRKAGGEEAIRARGADFVALFTKDDLTI